MSRRLWCTTEDDRLWRRFPTGANAPWTPVGHANDVRSLAGAAGRLWAVTADKRLWRRPPAERDIPWEEVGAGPAGGTLALAGTAFLLYAVDTAGKIWMAPAVAPAAWQEVPTMASARQPTIRAMAAYEDVLFAATSDAQLVRTKSDIVYEGNNQWLQVHHRNFATGLAAGDSMLFTCTTEDLLWWLDLRGRKSAVMPAGWAGVLSFPDFKIDVDAAAACRAVACCRGDDAVPCRGPVARPRSANRLERHAEPVELTDRGGEGVCIVRIRGRTAEVQPERHRLFLEPADEGRP